MFAWHVLGRSLALLMGQSAALLGLVLLLERAASDGEPCSRLAAATRRLIQALSARVRCAPSWFWIRRLFKYGALTAETMRSGEDYTLVLSLLI